MAEPRRTDDDEPAARAPQPVVTERTVTRQVQDPPPGPNASTDPPEGHYFINTNGDEVNAWGELKGSREDKARRAAGGIA